VDYLPPSTMMARCATLVLEENGLRLFSSQRNVLALPDLDYLCGPMRITSRGGKRYVFVVVDDYSRFTWTLIGKS